MTLLLFIAGLVALVVGAELLVRGASKLALSFGISPLVVGLTIVAFGTSAPEVAVSVGAVLDGKTDIAIGNVVGSNIFNVLFILGAVGADHAAGGERPAHPPGGADHDRRVAAAAGAGAGRPAGPGRRRAAVRRCWWPTPCSWCASRARETQAARDEYAAEVEPAAAGAWDARLPVQLALIVVGLGLLVLGSRLAGRRRRSVFAKALGVSDLVIGLTIVAAGTSMPEVATSIMAAIKGERDIAVGNVVGSNTFNILGCLGLSGLVAGPAGPGDAAVAAELRHLGDARPWRWPACRCS